MKQGACPNHATAVERLSVRRLKVTKQLRALDKCTALREGRMVPQVGLCACIREHGVSNSNNRTKPLHCSERSVSARNSRT